MYTNLVFTIFFCDFEKKLNPIFHGLNLNRLIFWYTSRLEIILPATTFVSRKLSFVMATALFSFDVDYKNYDTNPFKYNRCEIDS